MRLAKGQIDPPQTFDPGEAHLTIPNRLTFKRKPDAGADLGVFQGTWENTRAGASLTKMILIPTDGTHVNVRATYRGIANDVVSTAQWDDAAKQLKGTAVLAPGRPGNFRTGDLGVAELDSSYQIQNLTNTAQTLVVTNNQGFPRIFGGAGVTHETDTFSKTSS